MHAAFAGTFAAARYARRVPVPPGALPHAAPLPCMRVEIDDVRTVGLDPETTAQAAAAFDTAGCLLVERALDVGVIDAMHDAFTERYHEFLGADRRDDTLEVGTGRSMVTVRLEPPFASPAVYASPVLLPVVAALMGRAQLFAFGCVVSRPGAPDQHVHRDNPGLFGDPAIDTRLPTYAVSVLIPLVDMDEETGTTRLWPGTHRVPDVPPNQLPVDPIIRRGDALLADYRLVHGGTANRSQRPRPLLYNVYARPWFTDRSNYEKQRPLVIDRAELERIPPEHGDLFHAELIRDRIRRTEATTRG
jgi:ectoine hydroxylase-related dioxygenase (phytanoyl-CoA dioxygenase family)